METTMKLTKQSPEWKVEWYNAEISFSEDKDALKDLPALMKQLLEKQGHKVRRVVLSTAFEKAVSGGAGHYECQTAHVGIQSPNIVIGSRSESIITRGLGCRLRPAPFLL